MWARKVLKNKAALKGFRKIKTLKLDCVLISKILHENPLDAI